MKQHTPIAEEANNISTSYTNIKIQFTIGIEPKTKKNSQQIIMVKGRPMIIPSKAYREYEKNALAYLPTGMEAISVPVNIKASYYVSTRRRVDLTNLHEALHDILVHYNILADDNCHIVVSTDGSRVYYDKANPRTEVEITEVADEFC